MILVIEFNTDSFSVGGFSIAYYGVLIALGITLGVILASRREKRLSLPKDSALDVALISVPAAIVCARLYYVAFQWEMFRGDILSIINLRTGGLAIYGGLIGAVAAGFAYCRIKKVSFAKMADLAAPSIALGQAIGRWGNFFNQEAYGVEITSPALQFFPVGVYIDARQAWHCATFFYESVWCLAIVIFLLAAEKKSFFRKNGDMLLWYMLLYGLERALVEGLRTDSLYLGPLRVSQALSIVLIFAAALIFALRNKPNNKITTAGTVIAAVAMILSLFKLTFPALTMVAISVICISAGYPRINKEQGA